MTKRPSSLTLKTNIRSLAFAIGALAVFFGSAHHAQAQTFSQTVFFGDSLTDTGRFTYLAKNSAAAAAFASAQPAFTTNPDSTWASTLAQAYGQSATANNGTTTTDGNNYAVGGARVAQTAIEAFVINIPSATEQIDSYLSMPGGTADPDALYTVWVGANDLLASNSPQTIIQAAIAQSAAVAKLQQAGATHILVPNLPDVGLTPKAINEGTSTTATQAALLYNTTLYQALKAQNITVIPANTFKLLQEAVTNAQAFGFENVTQTACTVSSIMCDESNWQATALDANNTYAFADGIHPTGRTHRILAQYYQSIIDSPTQMGQLPNYLLQNGKSTQTQLNRRLNLLNGTGQSIWADAQISNQQTGPYSELDKPNITLGMNWAKDDSRHTGAYLRYHNQDYALSETLDADVKEVGLGLYHRHDLGKVRIQAGLGMDRLSVDTNRQIAWEGQSRSHQANATGRRVYGSLQGSVAIAQDKLTYRPYLGLNAQQVKVGELLENNASSSTAMNFYLDEQNSLQGELGLNVDYAHNARTAFFAGLGYQHEFKDDNQSIKAALATMQQNAFSLPVSVNDKDNLVLNVGAKVLAGANTQISAGIHANHSDGDTDVGGFVGVQSSF